MVHHLETVLRYVSSFRHLLTGQLRTTPRFNHRQQLQCPNPDLTGTVESHTHTAHWYCQANALVHLFITIELDTLWPAACRLSTLHTYIQRLPHPLSSSAPSTCLNRAVPAAAKPGGSRAANFLTNPLLESQANATAVSPLGSRVYVINRLARLRTCAENCGETIGVSGRAKGFIIYLT
jgi:hypothetical protein